MLKVLLVEDEQYIAPVSYTHLDVYKRQELRLPLDLFCRCSAL